MVMSEKLLMLKCESDNISIKEAFVISQSLGTKEQINAMIQMHTMLKILLSNYKLIGSRSFLIHGTLQMVCISFFFLPFS
jgi:hypothetical protein